MTTDTKKINCGAWCKKCGKQKTRYGRDHGVYTYECLHCGNTGAGFLAKFSDKKPRRVGSIYA